MSLIITDLTNEKSSQESIDRVTEKEKNDDLFIDKKKLVDNTSAVKIAYIHRISLAKSSIDTPYIKVVLKDRDGFSITGVMFNVDERNVGKSVLALQGHIARIDYEVQDYDGSLSLKIYSIDEYPEDMINTSNFFNPIEGLEEMKNYIDSKLDEVEPMYVPLCKLIKGASMLKRLQEFSIDMWYNRKGGALKLAYKVIKQIESLELSKVDKSLENRLIALTVITLYQQGVREDSIDLVNIKFDLDLGTEKTVRVNNKFWSKAVELYNAQPDKFTEEFILSLEREGKHLFYASLGLIQPKTVTAKLICMYIQKVKDTLLLLDTYNKMMDYTSTYVDGDLLVKLGGF